MEDLNLDISIIILSMIDGCTPVKRLRLKEWIQTQPDSTLFTKTHCKLNSVGNWKSENDMPCKYYILHIKINIMYALYMPIT